MLEIEIPAAFASPTFPPVNTPDSTPPHSYLSINKWYVASEMLRIPMFPW